MAVCPCPCSGKGLGPQKRIPSCLQGLLLFAALLQGSLWLALAVSAVAVPLLQSALHVRQRPTAAAPAAAALAGALGLALTGGAALSAGPRASQGLALVLLALWGAVAAVQLAWGHILREPTAVRDLAGGHSGCAGGGGAESMLTCPSPSLNRGGEKGGLQNVFVHMSLLLHTLCRLQHTCLTVAWRAGRLHLVPCPTAGMPKLTLPQSLASKLGPSTL